MLQISKAVKEDNGIFMVVIITIGFILLLTGISILRALESRNEWRRIAQEDNPDKVFNKIEDKKK